MDKNIIEKIDNLIESKKDEIIDFTRILVKELSETPPGNEVAVSNLIKSKAKEWNLPDPEIWAKKENRPNLIFKLKGTNSGKILVLNSHIDTKPIGDISKWTVNPLEPQIIDGRLYGRGSTDMKGCAASMITTLWAINNSGLDFNGDLILALTADEEGGSAFGAKVLIEKELKADAILIGEPSGINSNFDTLGLACRGALLAKIIVHGTQMHSSLSDQTHCINASVKMAEVMVEFSKNLKGKLHYKPHFLYPNGPTINPGVILEGGIFYGVVPGVAGFGFDLRVIPGMTFEGVKRDIENFLSDLMKKDKDLDVELVLEKPPLNTWIPAAEIDKDHPIVKACRESTKIIKGFEPELIGVPFGTDGCFLANELNIPTISSFGPGFIKLAHGPDEYIDVDSIIDAAKIYSLTSLIYLNS